MSGVKKSIRMNLTDAASQSSRTVIYLVKQDEREEKDRKRIAPS